MKQGRCPGQQQQTNQQKQPGKKPDRQTPQQPLLSHLMTMCCDQCQLDGRVTADPGCFTPNDKEDQGVKEGQRSRCQSGEGEESDSAPATFLTLPDRQYESNAKEQRGLVIMTDSVQEHV